MSFGRCASTTVGKGVAGLVVAVVGAVAAMGGMGITVVAMDSKETVIIDNHHG